MAGQLFLIPTPLGEGMITPLPAYLLEQVHQIDVFIAERGKTARQFLKAIETPIPLQTMTFFELNKRTDPADIKSFLAPAINEGKNIGLLSEAGCPGVADPGALVVQLAHKRGIKVVPLVGPSSILLALMASGMNGQQFAFHGYLPIKSPERKKALKDLERQSAKKNQTQIFIETPYRNDGFVEDALSVLQPQTLFGIATDITLPTEYICTQSVQVWRKKEIPKLHKRPTIFLLLAN
ncbi:SAM-dependent methyltransferase [Aureispira anguillae]|uniref:SAM-dependent methyltransferase n=1 Tax=Aureispira anguillae TaxID=2864201 RepID=A0A915YK01_9BACT|nr:SAM-dependent methyltransferase [Aureispira anguillae]BDS14475.1 SAM-dependent methyltransferase [Aureispira anguillae]